MALWSAKRAASDDEASVSPDGPAGGVHERSREERYDSEQKPPVLAAVFYDGFYSLKLCSEEELQGRGLAADIA